MSLLTRSMTVRSCIWMFILAAMIWPAIGCDGGKPAAPASQQPPVIVASIHPLADLVRQLVDESTIVSTLLPADVSPHGFDPTPQQMSQISRANALVMVGMNLDPWAEKAGRSAGPKNLPIYRFSDLVGLTPPASQSPAKKDDHNHDDHDDHDHDHHDHTGPNAHLWLDPVLTTQFIKALTPKLKALLPEQALAIEARSQTLLAELHDLDQDYHQAFVSIARKELVTFHNAFDLLAQRYGLTVVTHLAPLDLSASADVTPDRLRQAIEAVQKHQLKVVYAEPQFPRQAMEPIRRATGADILILDPEGSPLRPGYSTYQELMRTNLKTLVQGQSQ